MTSTKAPPPQATAKGAKRFYKKTGVTAEPSGFAVTLDGRALRTPVGLPLILPNESLARAIAVEWAAQGERIAPHTLPLMQLAATAVDRVAPARDAVIEATLRYATTDLLCYRAADPPELVARQQTAWQPLLDWLADVHGARLTVTHGVLPVPQPQAAIETLAAALAEFSDFALGAVSHATGLLGSLVLSLALAQGRIDADGALAASLLDEIHQAERWGMDAEAEDRRENLTRDVHATARFLALL